VLRLIENDLAISERRHSIARDFQFDAAVRHSSDHDF
jgi:hypothetical protein